LAWTISFTTTALKQLAKLDRTIAQLIVRFIEEKIAGSSDARRYGHALAGDQKGRWRYRIGDYRVICELRNNELFVIVVALGQSKRNL
jgi:mRNA interferase RelE/StbE